MAVVEIIKATRIQKIIQVVKTLLHLTLTTVSNQVARNNLLKASTHQDNQTKKITILNNRTHTVDQARAKDHTMTLTANKMLKKVSK